MLSCEPDLFVMPRFKRGIQRVPDRQPLDSPAKPGNDKSHYPADVGICRAPGFVVGAPPLRWAQILAHDVGFRRRSLRSLLRNPTY
jgi:hypothetical protein